MDNKIYFDLFIEANFLFPMLQISKVQFAVKAMKIDPLARGMNSVESIEREIQIIKSIKSVSRKLSYFLINNAYLVQ